MCDKTLSEVLTDLDRNEPPVSDKEQYYELGSITFGHQLTPERLKGRGLYRQQKRSEKP